MKIAFSYLRFSSRPQERGDSLRRQTDLAVRYAQRHNLQLDERSYADLGVSAFRGANVRDGALGAFLKAVDEGVIRSDCVLLVESLDRVTRAEVMDALEIFTSIINRGITLVTLNDEQSYSRESIKDNWTKLIVSIAVLARANEESETKSKRVRAAWDNKRKSGKPLTAMGPSWLRLGEDRQTWQVLESEVEKVRLIFDMSLKGNGAPTIARHLNGTKVTPFRSDSWTNGTVQNVLGNRAVIGTFTPKNGEPPVDGYFPAVLDPEIFWAVQDGIRSRKWKGSSNEAAVTNLFTGLCWCHCGKRMRFVASAKPRYYLHCSSAYSNAGCSGERHPYRDITQDGLERHLLMWFHLDMELTYGHLDAGSSDVSGKTVMEGQLALKQAQLDSMIELMKAGSRRGAHEVLKLESEVESLTERLRTWAKPATQSALDQFNASFVLLQDMNREKDLTKRNDMRRAMRGSLHRLIERMVFHDGTTEKEGRQWKTVEITLKGDERSWRVEYPLPR